MQHPNQANKIQSQTFAETFRRQGSSSGVPRWWDFSQELLGIVLLPCNTTQKKAEPHKELISVLQPYPQTSAGGAQSAFSHFFP